MAPPIPPSRSGPDPAPRPSPLPAQRPIRPLPRTLTPPRPPEPAKADPPRDQDPVAAVPEPRRQAWTGSTHRPILQPWQAADANPETTGDWGTKHTLDTGHHRRKGRRLALLGLLVAGALSGIMIWQTAPRSGPPALPPPLPRAAPTLEPSPVRATADLVRQATDFAGAFLATTTIETRAALVRHPDVTRDRMQAWHTPANPLRPLRVRHFHDQWAQERVGQHTFLMLSMEMADFTTRAIALERHPIDGFKVDWESFESWSAMPWTEFLATAPATAVEFRVVVQDDTYYNFAYTDPAQWRCFKLSDPAGQAHCWGYCPAGSETATALELLLHRQRRLGTTHVKAIARLRGHAADRGRQQVVIESLVQDHWIKPEA